MEGRGNKPAATGETRAASRGKQSLKGRLRDSLRPDATFSVGLNGRLKRSSLRWRLGGAGLQKLSN